MTRLFSLHKRAFAFALLVGASIAAPVSPVRAAPLPSIAVASANPTEITERDIAASNEEVKMAYAALTDMWTTNFGKLGARFATPRLLRYRGAVRTACGVMPPNNAAYCPTNNSIYFDEVFVAAQAKIAAQELRTDGDMAAVGVIAHEMGHAVAIQVGYNSPAAYDNESAADCLAGAFAQDADHKGSLEPGDVEEAFFGMAAAADPTPELTGDRRIDRRILTRVATMGHGTRDQRMENFRTGLEGGAGACLDELRGL